MDLFIHFIFSISCVIAHTVVCAIVHIIIVLLHVLLNVLYVCFGLWFHIHIILCNSCLLPRLLCSRHLAVSLVDRWWGEEWAGQEAWPR